MTKQELDAKFFGDCASEWDSAVEFPATAAPTMIGDALGEIEREMCRYLEGCGNPAHSVSTTLDPHPHAPEVLRYTVRCRIRK